MKKTKKQSDNERISKLGKYKKVWLFVGALIIIYIILLFVPFVSAYAQYPLQVIRCGKLPVTATTFAAGFTYTPPGNNPYRVDVLTDRYFCTEDEAKAAGFRKYEYGSGVE